MYNGTLKVLAVDDDPVMTRLEEAAAARNDSVDLQCVNSARGALHMLEQQSFDLVLLDLGLGDSSGLGLINQVIAAGRGALVVVVTADDRTSTVVECMKRGAMDYLTKPVTPARFIAVFCQVQSILGLKQEISALRNQAGFTADSPEFARIITRSPLMSGLFRTMERLARSPYAVLVSGESGTGKELVSRAIHDLSKRSGQFIPVNVAGLDDALFSDTLFGHVKGAYTGAGGNRSGLVREADGGTLFLDEIGDIGPESQIKLLRFLQDGQFYPLGSDKPEQSMARLVLATNADLRARMREGTFRADLYYRLMIHCISVPPLRQRRDDIPLLVNKFMVDAAEACKVPVPKRIDGFLAAIESWDFPGNIRELYSLVQGATCLAEGGTLSATYALDYIRSVQNTPSLQEGTVAGHRESVSIAEDGRFLSLDEVTDMHIQEALRRSGGNQSLAARLLGISQSTISRRLGSSAMKNS